MSEDVYFDLGVRLNEFPLKMPLVEQYINLLREFYTEEQAKMGAEYPHGLFTAKEIAEKFNRDETEIYNMLEEMADNGLMFSDKSGEATKYSLIQFVPGVLEYQLMRGTYTPKDYKVAKMLDDFLYGEMAEILKEAMEGADADALAEMAPDPAARTVTVEAELPRDTEIYSYEKAREMVGRTPNEIVTIRPMKDGVIADFEVTEDMLREFIRKVGVSKFVRPRIIVSVPSGITEVEKRAVRDSAEHAGAREVYLIAEPMAAAIGVDLNIHQPVGSMIIDIGGGTTEIAVIALSGIVCDTSIRIAGDEMNQVIFQFLKRNYDLLIGEKTAEEIKCTIGSAVPLEEELTMVVKGRDLVKGVPKTIEISSVEIREALNEPISTIVDAVRISLERTPPELAADILDRGIILTGGGALLKGIDERLREETNLPIHVAEDPLTCVVRGTGKILDDIENYSKLLLRSRRG